MEDITPSDCAICHRPATVELGALRCGHVFHLNCIGNLQTLGLCYKERTHCPICKRKHGYVSPLRLFWKCETGCEGGDTYLRDENTSLKADISDLQRRLNKLTEAKEILSARHLALQRDRAAAAEVARAQAERIRALDRARADSEGHSYAQRERLMIAVEENNARKETTKLQAKRLEALERASIATSKIAADQAELLWSLNQEKAEIAEAQRKHAARAQILEQEITTEIKAGRKQAVLLKARECSNVAGLQLAKARGVQLRVVQQKQAAAVKAAEPEGVCLCFRKRQAADVVQARTETRQQTLLKRLRKSATGGSKTS